MGIPVVIIRGMLEAGKTAFIKESLINKDFGDLGKTLILAQEEGIEEYGDSLKKCKTDVYTFDSKEDWCDKKINDIVRQYKPQVIFVEVNEMWDFNPLTLPSYFDIQQVMTIIDGTTFNAYFNNMRQRFVDMLKATEIVIINRCKPTEETSQFKKSIKIINSACAVIALDENGTQLKLESDLPFSLKEDVIKLSLTDFGDFYIDTFENKERYNGRIVEFECMATFSRSLPPKSFVAGRMAMTCCADDIQLIGHLCAYKGDLHLKNKTWVKLKAAIHYMKFRGSDEEQIILDAIEITEIPPKSDDEALLKLV